MSFPKLAACVTFIAVLAAAACASDLTLGSTARSIAMGGAGLALGDESGTTAVLNPAAPAVVGSKFRFIWPGLRFNTKGASISDLADSLSNISDGSTEDAISLVNDFAKRPTTLSFSTVAGFSGQFGLMVEAEAQGVITPSRDAAEWATASLKFDDNPSVDLDLLASSITNTNFQNMITKLNSGDAAGAQTDFGLYLDDLSKNYVDADIVYGPTVMLSRGFKRPGGTLYLGASAKILHSEARRWQITAEEDPANPLSGSGSNITAGVIFDAVESPVQKDNSLKVDLGMIYKPRNSMWHYGAVLNNAVKPSLAGFANSREDPMLSLGIAAVPTKGVIFAADLVNITGANNSNAQLRFGAETRLGSLFALRAGYSGQNWTYGFKLLGINVAFSGGAAQLLTNVIRF